MKKIQSITLKLADIAPMPIKIDADEEQIIREAEYGVNSLWRTWCKKLDGKTSHEVITMVAYQYARYFYRLQHNVEDQQSMLKDFEGELDRLLELTADCDVIADGDSQNNNQTVN